MPVVVTYYGWFHILPMLVIGYCLLVGKHIFGHISTLFAYLHHGSQFTPVPTFIVNPLQFYFPSSTLRHHCVFDLTVPQQFIVSVCKSSNNSEVELSTHNAWPTFSILASSKYICTCISGCYWGSHKSPIFAWIHMYVLDEGHYLLESHDCNFHAKPFVYLLVCMCTSDYLCTSKC
jgi:hypothetical protein